MSDLKNLYDALMVERAQLEHRMNRIDVVLDELAGHIGDDKYNPAPHAAMKAWDDLFKSVKQSSEKNCKAALEDLKQVHQQLEIPFVGPSIAEQDAHAAAQAHLEYDQPLFNADYALVIANVLIRHLSKTYGGKR